VVGTFFHKGEGPGRFLIISESNWEGP
jgi:hypothetical protein